MNSSALESKLFQIKLNRFLFQIDYNAITWTKFHRKFVNVLYNWTGKMRWHSFFNEKIAPFEMKQMTNNLVARFVRKSERLANRYWLNVDCFICVEVGSVFEIIDSNVRQLIFVNFMAGTTKMTIIDRSITHDQWICIQHVD